MELYSSLQRQPENKLAFHYIKITTTVVTSASGSAPDLSNVSSPVVLATNFEIPDSPTGFDEEDLPDFERFSPEDEDRELEEIVGEDGANASRPEGRAFRPNGMHTRIIPAWSPGLYQ